MRRDCWLELLVPQDLTDRLRQRLERVDCRTSSANTSRRQTVFRPFSVTWGVGTPEAFHSKRVCLDTNIRAVHLTHTTLGDTQLSSPPVSYRCTIHTDRRSGKAGIRPTAKGRWMRVHLRCAASHSVLQRMASAAAPIGPSATPISPQTPPQDWGTPLQWDRSATVPPV